MPETHSVEAPSPSDANAQLTAAVVSAFVAHNATPAAALPDLVHKVHEAFSALGQPVVEVPVSRPKPAVPVRTSITDDYLVSLLDGCRYKSLKRHLTTRGHTPESYRATFGLPADYPMTCKTYSEKRSDLAKKAGLGKRAAAA